MHKNIKIKVLQLKVSFSLMLDIRFPAMKALNIVVTVGVCLGYILSETSHGRKSGQIVSELLQYNLSETNNLDKLLKIT